MYYIEFVEKNDGVPQKRFQEVVRMSNERWAANPSGRGARDDHREDVAHGPEAGVHGRLEDQGLHDLRDLERGVPEAAHPRQSRRVQGGREDRRRGGLRGPRPRGPADALPGQGRDRQRRQQRHRPRGGRAPRCRGSPAGTGGCAGRRRRSRAGRRGTAWTRRRGRGRRIRHRRRGRCAERDPARALALRPSRGARQQRRDRLLRGVRSRRPWSTSTAPSRSTSAGPS